MQHHVILVYMTRVSCDNDALKMNIAKKRKIQQDNICG